MTTPNQSNKTPEQIAGEIVDIFYAIVKGNSVMTVKDGEKKFLADITEALSKKQAVIEALKEALIESNLRLGGRLCDINDELKHKNSMAEHYVESLQNKKYRTELAIEKADKALALIKSEEKDSK